MSENQLFEAPLFENEAEEQYENGRLCFPLVLIQANVLPATSNVMCLWNCTSKNHNDALQSTPREHGGFVASSEEFAKRVEATK